MGGPDAQHLVDAAEKDRRVTRARYLGAKLLGKLAGFIVQPVPGMDYSQDAMPPADMFVAKILLPNLAETRSAFKRAAVSLVVAEWSDMHGGDGVRAGDATAGAADGAPDRLKLVLVRFLTEEAGMSYEETARALATLQTEVR